MENRSVSHTPKAEDAAEVSIDMVVLASIKGVIEGQASGENCG